MLSGCCAKTEWQRGMPVFGFMTDAVQRKVPFGLLFLQSLPRPASPNPVHSSELWPEQLLQLSTEGSKFSSVRLWKLVTGGPCWYSSSTSSLWRKGKEKTKHRKINFLVSLPPSPLLLRPSLSVSPSLWDLSCLFSCPSLIKYVNEQMDSGLSPVPCSITLAHRPALNVRNRVTVLTLWPAFILSHFSNCQRFHFHVNS